MHTHGRLFSATAVARLALVLVVGATTAVGCREKAPTAKPDPTPSAPPSSSVSAKSSAAPMPIDSAVVEIDRIEIPRAFFGPVVLELPRVRGLGSAPLDAAVNALLAPEKILGDTLESVRDDAKEVKTADDTPMGVQSADFETLYNRRGLLEIVAFVSFFGAYPSTNRFHVLVDLRTGKPIGAESFLAARVPALLKRLDAEVAAELKAKLLPAGLSTSDTYDATELGDVSVGDQGLTFHHDYGFPHAYLALQPPGSFFHPWADIGADIDPQGPLARAKP